MSKALNDETVELQDVESFHFFYKCLWEKGSAKRTHLNILDTIIYQQGRPWRWLFTSNDGTVMKRNDANLNQFEILKVFKAKAKLSKGRRDHRSRGKIAVVWFVNHRNAVHSYFVDDLQLRSILEEAVFEILAIQLHIGGYPVKGSGVFEHRYYVRKDGRPIYNTHELVHPSTNEVSIYQDSIDRLGISESQHDTIKLINKKIIRFIETRTRGTVANIVLQVVFTSSWIPFITSCRGILLWNPMQKLTLYRSEMVFICDPPLPPREAAKQNHLLPKNPEDIPDFGMMTMTWGANKSKQRLGKPGVDAGTGVDLFDGIGSNADGTLHHTQTSALSTIGTAAGDGNHHPYQPHPYQPHTQSAPSATGSNNKKSVSIMEGCDRDGGDNDNTSATSAAVGESKEAHLHDKLHAFAHERESDHGTHFNVDDTGRKVSVYGAVGSPGGNDEWKDTLSHGNNDSIGPTSDNDKSRDPQLAAAAPDQTTTWRDRNRALSRYDDGDLHFRAKPPGQGQGRFLNGAGRRPMSASATGSHFPAGLRVPGKAKNNAFDRLSNAKPDQSDMIVTASETILPGKGKNAIFKSAAYGHTSSSKTKLEFYVNQLKHADSLPVEKLLNSRRPISAPHNSKKSGSARGVGVPLGGHGMEGGGRRSSGFERKAPLASGCVCFGDYCFLGEFHASTEDISAEVEREKANKEAEKKEDPGYYLTNADASAEVSSSIELNPSGAHKGVGVKGDNDDSSDIADEGDLDVEELKALDKEHHKKKSVKIDMGYTAHVDKVNPHDLKPQLLKYQLPFRSIILLRSEEDFLKTKIYDVWTGDDHIVESKERRESREREFRLHDHNKKLLDLTQRHLRRVAYCCLSDVRKTVVAMPAIHSTSSGFQMQWDNLSQSYRKLVYADALAKTHPARFYQTVPMCDTCQFIYSMADMHREEIVMGGGHRPPSKPSHGTLSSPKKRVWSNGIEEAKEIGRSRRVHADQSGSFRSIPLAEKHYNNYSWKGKGITSNQRGARTRGGGDISRSRSRRQIGGRPSSGGGGGYPSGGYTLERMAGNDTPSDSNSAYEALFDEYMAGAAPGSEQRLHYDEHEMMISSKYNDGHGEHKNDGSMASVVQRLKNETAAAAAGGGGGNDQVMVGLNTSGGTVSSWVKMLSEHEREEGNRSHLEAGIEHAKYTQNHPYAYKSDTGSRPHTVAGTSSGKREGDDSADKDRPNPMGPLAGQGIGGPLGMNYRNYAAPVGFMLGQTSGDVGSTYIDKEGNFLHPKKRSPADRGHPVPVDAEEKYPEYRETAAKEMHLLGGSAANGSGGVCAGTDRDGEYNGGVGIAYNGNDQGAQQQRTRPSTAGNARKSKKERGARECSTKLQSDMLTHMNMMDLGTYQYSGRTSTVSTRPASAHTAAGRHSGSAIEREEEEGMVKLNEYGPNAPYLPLRRSPPKNKVSPGAGGSGSNGPGALSASNSPLAYLGKTGSETSLPVYRSGGTSFEHMIRESQKFHKATLKLEKEFFSKKDNKAQNRRVVSGRQGGGGSHSPKKSRGFTSSKPTATATAGNDGNNNMSTMASTGLETSVHTPTTTEIANLKQSQLDKSVDDIGYLGGLDIENKHKEMDRLYTQTQPKLVLGLQHSKGPASFGV